MDELLNKLVEETGDEIDNLKNLDAGSDKHSKAVESVAKLYNLAHNEEKLMWEAEKLEKEAEREDMRFKIEEGIRNEGYDREDNKREEDREHEKELHKIDVESEERRYRHEKHIARRRNIVDLVVMGVTTVTTIGITAFKVGQYHRMQNEVLKFETDGTISTNQGRNHQRNIGMFWR